MYNQKLAAAIAEKDIRKKAIARKIGIGDEMISRYLSGKVLPRVDHAIQIAKILDKTVEELFGKERQ